MEATQKKINQLQVEHVSEAEVDQLFYALEVSEQKLEQAMKEKDALEEEVRAARSCFVYRVCARVVWQKRSQSKH